MPQIKSLEELRALRQQLQNDVKARSEASTTITVGMGTCGIAAGAREVMAALLNGLAERNLDAHVTTVGCIGMCSREPLVDVVRSDQPKITYGNVSPDMVPRILEEHVSGGHVVEEWVVARAAA
jgi:NADP-reducing hydrogenase subunit HndB